jgi:heterodisulfide reductase subunit C
MGSPDELPLVTDSDLDPGFADRVRATPGGEGILHCYACGTCSASCPIRAIDDEFNPRRIIRLALLGLKDEVLRSQFIWLCTGCFICQERCPQDVRITDLMMALRNIATEEGYPHPTLQAIAEALEAHGAILEIGEFENDRRTKAGLPARHMSAGPVKDIIEGTGLGPRLREAKGKAPAAKGGEGA